MGKDLMSGTGHVELWITVAAQSKLAPGQVLGLRIGDRHIAIYNVDGEYFATDNVCTHAFALLHEGYLDGHVIECPLHGGCFDIRNGEGLGAPIIHDLKTYETRVVGEDIQIRLPSE